MHGFLSLWWRLRMSEVFQGKFFLHDSGMPRKQNFSSGMIKQVLITRSTTWRTSQIETFSEFVSLCPITHSPQIKWDCFNCELSSWTLRSIESVYLWTENNKYSAAQNRIVPRFWSNPFAGNQVYPSISTLQKNCSNILWAKLHRCQMATVNTKRRIFCTAQCVCEVPKALESEVHPNCSERRYLNEVLPFS